MTPKERAAMQQALEALEYAKAISDYITDKETYEEAITALREALAKQSREAVSGHPCEIVEADFAENIVTVRMLTDSYKVSAGIKFLCDAAPQKREWVELSEEKLREALGINRVGAMSPMVIANNAIAAFKEANE